MAVAVDAVGAARPRSRSVERHGVEVGAEHHGARARAARDAREQVAAAGAGLGGRVVLRHRRGRVASSSARTAARDRAPRARSGSRSRRAARTCRRAAPARRRWRAASAPAGRSPVAASAPGSAPAPRRSAPAPPASRRRRLAPCRARARARARRRRTRGTAARAGSGRDLNSGWYCEATKNGWSGQLDHLDQAVVRRGAAAHQAGVLEPAPQQVVDLVAVAVALVDHGLVVGRAGARAGVELHRVGAQAHRAAHVVDLLLLRQQVDHRDTASRGRTRPSWRRPCRPRGGRSRRPRAACRGRCRGTGSRARARRARR